MNLHGSQTTIDANAPEDLCSISYEDALDSSLTPERLLMLIAVTYE